MTVLETADGQQSTATPVLAAREVTVRFGGLTAVNNVDIEIPPATIIGLVGPNGAGKTTLFNVISGLQRPNRGRVEINGEDVTDAPAHIRARKGMGRTFQQLEMFQDL